MVSRLRSRMLFGVTPPIELHPAVADIKPTNILDTGVRRKLRAWNLSGCVVFHHFGIPCRTLTSARRNDGGPRPLRSNYYPEGLPELHEFEAEKVRNANDLIASTLEIIADVVAAKFHFSIENPLFSFLWRLASVRQAFRHWRHVSVCLDFCMFGAPWRKPTRLETNFPGLRVLAKRCPGRAVHGHRHVVLAGREWDAARQRLVWKTTAAQVYPDLFSRAFAKAAR